MSFSDVLNFSTDKNEHFKFTHAVPDFSIYVFMFKFNHVIKLMELINSFFT